MLYQECKSLSNGAKLVLYHAGDELHIDLKCMFVLYFTEYINDNDAEFCVIYGIWHTLMINIMAQYFMNNGNPCLF